MLKKDNYLYLKEKNTIKKEKFYIWKMYYGFILNKSCMLFLEKAYEALNKHIEKQRKNDLFLTDSDSKLAILIIVLKSNLKFKPLTNEDYYIGSNEAVNYCSDMFHKYCISRQFFFLEKKRWQLFILIFSILIDANLITTKIIELRESNYKTLTYYNFPNIDYKLQDEEFLNFSFTEYKIIEFEDKLYVNTYHFSKLYEISKKNFFSGKAFRPKNIYYIFQKINIKLYIDEDFFKEMENFKSKDDIIQELSESFKNLKNIYDLSQWTIETKQKIKILQQKHSKLLEEYAVRIFLDQKENINSAIFFPMFFDFRGRKYYDSIIGPTQCKILRTAYHYGYYKQEDFLKQDPLRELSDNFEFIKDICIENNYEFESIFYNTYYWLLIGIGKHLVNKNKFPIKELEFLEAAREYLKNRNTKLKQVDLLEVKHYEKIMKNLTLENFKNNKIKKYIIMKDATASVNQILVKKLNPKNQEALNYLNLGEVNEWYDTYMVHREKFISYLKKKDPIDYDSDWIRSVTPRGLIKKVIMIVPYSAGFDLCWEAYVNQIKEENYDIIINDELKILFKKFFIFVKKTMQEKYLYEKSSYSFFKKISEEFEQNRKFILESDTGEADVSYYKMRKTSVEKRYKGESSQKRVTKLMLITSEALDLEAFNSAIGPNFAHFFDGDEVREIELSLNKFFITIHDCYLVDMLSCYELIQAKQKHYNKYFQEYKVKNIFILL